MPSCAGCFIWYKGPEISSADEQEYIYCPSCRTPTYLDKEYVGGDCSFDLFSGYDSSESKTGGNDDS